MDDVGHTNSYWVKFLNIILKNGTQNAYLISVLYLLTANDAKFWLFHILQKYSILEII